MNKKIIGILFVAIFVTSTICVSAISNNNVNEYEERPSSKSFHLYRCLIIGIVSNYDEDAEYIYMRIFGLGLAVEIYEGNPYRPVALGILNEQGKWKKPINDCFRGILTPHVIFGIYRV